MKKLTHRRRRRRHRHRHVPRLCSWHSTSRTRPRSRTRSRSTSPSQSPHRDNHSMEQLGKENVDIALSGGDQLTFYTKNGTKTGSVRFKSQNLAALAYDEIHNMILYVDKQGDNDGDAISGYDLSTSQYKYYVERKGRNIQGLAVDPVTEKLFFTDTIEKSVNWISLKPGLENNIYGNLLIKLDAGIPTDIAVDSCRGYVYWINTNLTKPAIERARFNGSEREVIVFSSSVYINATYKLEPHSLAINQKLQKMYWVEPVSISKYYIYEADLNGKNKEDVSHYVFSSDDKILTNISNILMISNSSLITWIWCSDGMVWEVAPAKTVPNTRLFRTETDTPLGIAVNYKIEQQIQGLHSCETLTNLVRNTSVTDNSLKLATEYDGPFCVHGIKVRGQSRCKCTFGYIGERCDVSVCQDYCLQGNCSVNDEGKPICSCYAGYYGTRCEDNACFNFCLNNGECSLSEEEEAVCQCAGNYEGLRCEFDINDTTPTYDTVKRNTSLDDLFSKWRKPGSKLFVTVEV